MTPHGDTSAPGQASSGLRIEWLSPANLGPVLALAAHAWDRSRGPASVAWRYDRCPGLEAAVALSGDECVACVFGIRRTYWTSAGDIECVEPFDWFTQEAWRPKGAGLRVMRHLMAGPNPLLAMGGSAAARKLFLRLGWKPLGMGYRMFLPLSGRFLESRGRTRLVARAFDLLGRPIYRPRGHQLGPLRVEPAGTPGPALDTIIQRQRRFALVARPSETAFRWLRNAPPEMGTYLGFNLIAHDRMVGWAWARIYTSRNLRLAELHDLILEDDAVTLYPVALRHLLSVLAGFGPDGLYAVTSCPHTLAVLRSCRFRVHHDVPLFGWWPNGEAPAPVLVTGSHAEYSFFPASTARDSAWVLSADSD